MSIMDTQLLEVKSPSSLDLNKIAFESQAERLELKPTYKDDLESLAYTLMHLASGGKIINLKEMR